jgi:hypothetical protein
MLPRMHLNVTLNYVVCLVNCLLCGNVDEHPLVSQILFVSYFVSNSYLYAIYLHRVYSLYMLLL